MMTFEEWWKEMKPAECDELKEHFVDSWNTAIEDCAWVAENTAAGCDAEAIADAIRARGWAANDV